MTATLWNHRGCTAHEMLDNVALVHMKGRVYDPTFGRFLSPDPVLNDLRNPQGINRYGYVAGNPLTLTDPTGYSPCGCPADGTPTIVVKAYISTPSFSIDVAWFTNVFPVTPVPFSPVDWGLDAGTVPAQPPPAEPKKDMGKMEVTTKQDSSSWRLRVGYFRGGTPTGGVPPSVGNTAGSVAAEERPQGQEDSADPICSASGLGGGGLTLSQRADLARLQAFGGVVGGALLGHLPRAVLGYGAAIGYNAYGLRAGGALVQGGSQQGHLVYGAAAQGLGIPLPAAQRFAGFYEQYGPNFGGRYASENGTFYGDPPYGDDPGAQQAIAEGYACGQ